MAHAYYINKKHMFFFFFFCQKNIPGEFKSHVAKINNLLTKMIHNIM